MGRREGSTKSKTQECTLNNPQTIHLLNTDKVEYYKVDGRGYIHTNKRGWVGLKATVLIGHIDVEDDKLYTTDKVFSCEVIAGGFISSLSKEYENQEVTVIIHE